MSMLLLQVITGIEINNNNLEWDSAIDVDVPQVAQAVNQKPIGFH